MKLIKFTTKDSNNNDIYLIRWNFNATHGWGIGKCAGQGNTEGNGTGNGYGTRYRRLKEYEIKNYKNKKQP
jgi:hypothetical protein